MSPPSALTEGEVAHLFTIIRDLRAQGKADHLYQPQNG